MKKGVFNQVPCFIKLFVILSLLFSVLLWRDDRSHSLIRCLTKNVVGIIAPVGQQPLCLWQAAHQRRRAGVVADLACGHEEADRATIGIGDGMQLGVHAAFRAADQTATLVAWPPFFDRRLVAVRCALR